ncbi:MAG: hypothetical protein ACPGOY_13435 [Rhodospirillaceae bacterium]
MSRLIRTALCCLALFATAACQTIGAGEATQAGDPALRAQVDDFGETVAGGALLGAVVGAAAGLLITGDVGGALVGAVVGGGVGAGAGAAVGSAKGDYVQAENELDQKIANAQEENQKLADINLTAKRALQRDKARLANLKSKVSKGEITQKAADRSLADAKANREHLAQAIAFTNESIEDVQEDIKKLKSQGVSVKALQSELKKLQNNKKTLSQNLSAYDKLIEAQDV